MTKKEQFLNVWVKKLPDSEQRAFIRQLEALLQPVVDTHPKQKTSPFQKLLRWRMRAKYNKMVRELASIRAMLEVYAIHSDMWTRRKVARLRGRKASLETHAQQIRDTIDGATRVN